MKFYKSLKFKLAFWYSTLLFLFCAGFILVLNLLIGRYMQIETSFPGPRGGFMRNAVFRDFTEDQRTLLQEARNADLDRIRDLSVYSLFPFVILSFFGGYVIADRNLRPLERLNEEMSKRNTKDLYTDIKYNENGDEISSLISSFNKMSTRLGRSFESQKEFVENASHEIKTPLAIIQANIDSILQDSKISRKELSALLKNSKDSVTFMDNLTEDLLLLSFLDQEVKKEKVEIVGILKSCLNQAEKIADGFKIELEKHNKVWIKGNKMLLQRAFSNIIENAIKYSEGDTVSIFVKETSDNLEIRIKDNGKGIPKDKRKRIFERFYRIDKSRSKKNGGSGLGLAITAEVIKRHKGDIYLNDVKKGAEFVVTIPV